MYIMRILLYTTICDLAQHRHDIHMQCPKQQASLPVCMQDKVLSKDNAVDNVYPTDPPPTQAHQHHRIDTEILCLTLVSIPVRGSEV